MPKQARVLALCLIKDLNWYLIAREAQRPDGLDRLLDGDVGERSPQAAAARQILRASLGTIDELTDQARDRAKSGFACGARIVTVADSDYPLNLRRIFNRPPFLFYRGSLSPDEDAFSVAVVGTRDASDDGVRRARRLARGLVRQSPSVTVLSGLARGIDTAAHEAALDAGGRTVAVMGTGICHVYPRENEKLAESILKNGALVSQFWPDSPPSTYSFPRRNITMSGMGQGTVVVEASATSGAKMQARLALEHGKRVFLLPSLVQSHPWARNYLKRGAVVVESVDSILANLVSPKVIAQQAKQDRRLPLQLA